MYIYLASNWICDFYQLIIANFESIQYNIKEECVPYIYTDWRKAKVPGKGIVSFYHILIDLAVPSDIMLHQQFYLVRQLTSSAAR